MIKTILAALLLGSTALRLSGGPTTGAGQQEEQKEVHAEQEGQTQEEQKQAAVAKPSLWSLILNSMVSTKAETTDQPDEEEVDDSEKFFSNFTEDKEELEQTSRSFRSDRPLVGNDPVKDTSDRMEVPGSSNVMKDAMKDTSDRVEGPGKAPKTDPRAIKPKMMMRIPTSSSDESE